MKYRQLIQQSRQRFVANPGLIPSASYGSFTTGAKWMYDRMQEESSRYIPPFDRAKSYECYGWLKYGVCLCGFVIAVILFSKIHLLLVPVALLVFYLLEVHLLFLFPLLLEGIPNPVKESIRLTYQTGLLKAVIIVMPIGCYMMTGLFHFKKPLRNWYLGCLAIVIWYEEVRNRPSSSV